MNKKRMSVYAILLYLLLNSMIVYAKQEPQYKCTKEGVVIWKIDEDGVLHRYPEFGGGAERMYDSIQWSFLIHSGDLDASYYVDPMLLEKGSTTWNAMNGYMYDAVPVMLDFGYMTEYLDWMKENHIVASDYQLPTEFYKLEKTQYTYECGPYGTLHFLASDCPEAVTDECKNVLSRLETGKVSDELLKIAQDGKQGSSFRNYVPKYIRDQMNAINFNPEYYYENHPELWDGIDSICLADERALYEHYINEGKAMGWQCHE